MTSDSQATSRGKLNQLIAVLVLLSGIAALTHQLLWTRRLIDLLGVGVLALEVAAVQMFQLVATISLFSPAAVLFCAIVSLAVSAAVFARFEPVLISSSRRQNIAIVLAIGGALVVVAPQVFMAFASRSNWFSASEGVFQFTWKLGGLALISVGPAWLVTGLVFPFAVALAGKDCPPVRAGQRLGILLAINGLGGLLGAELTYRVLLPAFGVYGAMTAIGIALATLSGAIACFNRQASDGMVGGAVASAAIIVGLAIGRANTSLPVVNPPPGVDVVSIESGREGTVAVIEYSAATVRLSAEPETKYFNAANWIRFCRSRQHQTVNRGRAAQAELMLLSGGLMELDYARRTKNPLAVAIESRISQEIPRCFSEDRGAEVVRWPGPVVMPAKLNTR